MSDSTESGNDIIDGRTAFHRALTAALDEAATSGVQQLWLCDPDFADWPLAQAPVLDALGRWAHSQRRLTLLAADYTVLGTRFARWLAWRRQWSHIVRCLLVHEEEAPSVPSLLFVPGFTAVRLHDRDRHRGRIHRAATELAPCHQLLDALSQRAEESFPVTTLGL